MGRFEDEMTKTGRISSISNHKNNIHYFNVTAATFGVIILNLKSKPYDIHNVDPYKIKKLKEDLKNMEKIPSF